MLSKPKGRDHLNNMRFYVTTGANDFGVLPEAKCTEPTWLELMEHLGAQEQTDEGIRQDDTGSLSGQVHRSHSDRWSPTKYERNSGGCFELVGVSCCILDVLGLKSGNSPKSNRSTVILKYFLGTCMRC